MMTKHSQMKVIVVRPGVTVAPDTTRLYNPTTDAFNVADGGIGFFVETANSGNPTAALSPSAPFKVIQNRDTTADPATLYSRPLEESQWISPQCYLGIKTSVQNATLPSNNLLAVGPNAVSGSAVVPVLDEFTYRIQVSAHGDRTDWYNSVYNTPTVFGTYTSPDWTTTAYTTAQSRDITIQSLMYNFNGNSQSMAVGICLTNTLSNGGVLLSTVATNTATFPNGSKLIIGYTIDGQPVRITMDNAIRQAFAALNTAMGAGFYVQPYVLAGTPAITAAAPYTAGVIPVAGTTVNITDFAILAIDEGQAAFDYKINTKRRITLGLLKGFDNVLQDEIALPLEGTGLGRQLSIMYKANESYNQAARPQPYMSYHVQFPNEINENAFYDIFTIEHCHQRMATSGMPAVMPHTTVVAVPNFTLGGNININPLYDFDGAGPGVVNAQRTAVLTTLNNFNTNLSLGLPALV